MKFRDAFKIRIVNDLDNFHIGHLVAFVLFVGFIVVAINSDKDQHTNSVAKVDVPVIETYEDKCFFAEDDLSDADFRVPSQIKFFEWKCYGKYDGNWELIDEIKLDAAKNEADKKIKETSLQDKLEAAPSFNR